MKDVYLLAAGVLTGLAVPTSALPKLSIVPVENSPVPWNLKVESPAQQLRAEFSDSNSSLASPISPESTPPEFSNQAQTPATSVTPTTYLNIQSETSYQPLSGKQLYYQRLAALRLGQIYTRLGNEAMREQIAASKSKLTYEDWKGLLALEARAMGDGQGKNRLSIMVGDSLSMWFPKDKLPSGKLWLNQGISGDTSTGVLKRVSMFSKTRPDVIYVMAGINDLRKGTADEVILRNHRKIIRRLREEHPLTQIIVQSILPTRLPTISNNRIRKINQKLATISQEEGANYLNIHNWFTDFQGNLRPDLTTDGLHLSLNGYEVWQAAIHQVESKIAVSRTKTVKN
ncbi:SGNH/GDSL hydrolase family protein [Calothrix sp. UHCC 0171]|uniref:SGNH/GDSL hydrolase family protein n=1 Tax=Calothrix sp. UHCC 0171 TaxID=3110245 RepID=UPI002B21C237|nr:SGNH/GDSL hydrolase family protein [Calothrix sp. UHCC 0171]MEA5573330.1 SGNH/GDSL hydrolase family protein [Calothrix sp. UHCC 0171]